MIRGFRCGHLLMNAVLHILLAAWPQKLESLWLLVARVLRHRETICRDLPKHPVLAITSTRGNHKIGHLADQQIDRRNIPNDIAIESVTIPMVKDSEDERMCEIEANKAILVTL